MSKKYQNVEQLYLKERKTKNIFMISTAVFALLFVMSIALGWGVASDESNRGPAIDRTTAGPGGRGGQMLLRMFNDDGSINQEMVDNFKQRASNFGDEEQFMERFEQQILSAVESGTITEEQAEKLRQAFGINQNQEASDAV